MTDLNDTQLDAALEAVARPEPPRGHVAQVLEMTCGRAEAGRAEAGIRPRWLLPIAATVLVVVGATWQSDQQMRTRLEAVMDMETEIETARSENGPYPGNGPAPHNWPYPGNGAQLDLPVLPPQAYWGMDAFAEFESLRPGALAARPSGGRDASRRRSALARATSADDELAWVPLPSGLAPIQLPSIVPAPLVVAPLAPFDDIVLAEIPFEPIVIAPLIEEERP